MDDFPLLGMLVSISWFFLFIAWISCLITIFRDIFRSSDLSGAAKAGWAFLVMILPLIGVLAYLVARGSSMQDRDLQEAVRREQVFQEYIRSVAQTPAPTSAPMPAAT